MKNYQFICLKNIMNLICSHMNHNPEIYSSVSIYLAILKYTSFFSICVNLELTSYTSITEGTVKFWLKQAYQWGLFEEKYQSILLSTSIARIHSLQHRFMAYTVWIMKNYRKFKFLSPVFPGKEGKGTRNPNTRITLDIARECECLSLGSRGKISSEIHQNWSFFREWEWDFLKLLNSCEWE